MKRRSIWLGTFALIAAVAPLAVAADPEAKPANVDGKTVILKSGSGGFGSGGQFQPGRSFRVSVRPVPEKMEKGAYLGVMVSPVTAALRSQLKLQSGVGLVVESVETDSPADEAGIEQYDVLQQLNDQVLIDPHQFGVLVRLAKPGDEIALKVLHKGEPATVKAKLVEKELPPIEAADDLGRRMIDESFVVERSEEPMTRAMEAMEMLRKNRDVIGKMSYSDKGMTLQITQRDGKRDLVAKDAKGKVLYNGPINTEEERKRLPPEVAKRLKDMDMGAATTRPGSAAEE